MYNWKINSIVFTFIFYIKQGIIEQKLYNYACILKTFFKSFPGDIMGCGILFPPDYDQEEANAAVDENEDDAENEDSPSEYGDDEEYEEDAHPKQVEDMEEQAGTVEVR